MKPESLFSLSDHLERLSKDGDPLEVLEATVDFEYFRGWLVEGLGYGDGSKGGRPPFDPVAMFKVLIVQTQHNLSDAKMEFMIRDRLSWMRFFGFALGDTMPDENTIRHFRNRMTETGTLKRMMKAFDWQLHKKGYIPMSGQIVDASLVPAPKQRNTEDEKAAIKEGKSANEIWPDEPNKAAQKDTDARWTLKIGGKVRYRPDGTPLPQIALPVFGYKSHISIDRRFGFIREGTITSASGADGRELKNVDACARRVRFTKQIDLLLEEVDLLLAPTLPVLHPSRDAPELTIAGKPYDFTMGMVRQTCLFDHTGHPALAMPMRASGVLLPPGLQIVGRCGGEADILKFAMKLEQVLSEPRDP